MLLKVCLVDQQQKHGLVACEKCRVSGPTLKRTGSESVFLMRPQVICVHFKIYERPWFIQIGPLHFLSGSDLTAHLIMSITISKYLLLKCLDLYTDPSEKMILTDAHYFNAS